MEHKWEKQNNFTLKDRDGLYDLWVCKNCGRKYKRRGLAWNPPHSQCKSGPTPHPADAEQHGAADA
jgi:hypothetical protein